MKPTLIITLLSFLFAALAKSQIILVFIILYNIERNRIEEYIEILFNF